MIVVPYYPLADDVMQQIIQLQARQDRRRGCARTTRPTFELRRRRWSTTIAGRCKEVESGARNVDHILTGTLLPEISREVLGRMATGDGAKTLRVTVEPDGRFGYAFA